MLSGTTAAVRACLLTGLLVSQAMQGRAQTIQLRPSERIDVESRIAGYRSDRVSHAALLRSGAVVLADHAGDKLIVLESKDRRARSFGRNGAGPGEFRSIRSLAVCGGDTVAVLDAMLMRIAFFDAAGTSLGQISVQGMPNALNCSDSGMLAVQSFTAPPVPGRMATGEIVHLTRDGSRIDSPANPLLKDLPFGEQGPLGRTFTAVLLGRSLAYGSGDSTGIQVIAEGRQLTRFAAGVPGRRITEAQYEPAVETIASSIPGTPADFERMRSMIRRLPRPKELPAFATFVVDETAQEYYIQRSFAPDNPTIVERRARDGTMLQVLALPGTLRLLHARNRVLLTTEIGEEVLPNLLLFTVTR